MFWTSDVRRLAEKVTGAGLDSTQTDGVNAVASLEEIIDFLKKIGENDDDVSIFVACWQYFLRGGSPGLTMEGRIWGC